MVIKARRIAMCWKCSMNGRKPKGKRQPWRLDKMGGFKMDLMEAGCEYVGCINSLKLKFILIFKDLIHTSKKTQHFDITKINWLMPFK
jgi:hypothetical protein